MQVLQDSGFLSNERPGGPDLHGMRGDGRDAAARGPGARGVPETIRAHSLHAGEPCLVNAMLVAGLFPNVAAVSRKGRRPPRCFTDEDGQVSFHPSSILMAMDTPHDRYASSCHCRVPVMTRSVGVRPWSGFVLKCGVGARECRYAWAVFTEKLMTTEIYLSTATAVSPGALLLFGGELRRQGQETLGVVPGFIEFKAHPVCAGLIAEMRRGMDRVLQSKLEAPGTDVTEVSRPLIQASIQLLRDC